MLTRRDRRGDRSRDRDDQLQLQRCQIYVRPKANIIANLICRTEPNEKD